MLSAVPGAEDANKAEIFEIQFKPRSATARCSYDLLPGQPTNDKPNVEASKNTNINLKFL